MEQEVENRTAYTIDTVELMIYERITSLKKKLKSRLTHNEAKEVFGNLVLQELIVRLMQTQARTLLLSPETALANVNRLAHVAQYINKNISRNLQVRELAEEACMSEPDFYRTFKQTFGLTPVDYINKQPIALVYRLLRTANRSLGDISVECGFNNLTYFMKMFRPEIHL